MENQVPENERHRRAAYLAGIQKEIQENFLDRYIQEHSEKPVYVLCEKWENGIANGHTEHFIECNIRTDKDTTGLILSVIPESRNNAVLSARLK